MASLDTLVSAIVERLTRPWRTFLGFYAYRVQSQTGERVTLQSVGTSLPDQLHLDKAHGMAGQSEQCALGSIVLVGFQGGDPGAPFVAFYLPSVPVRATVDATTTIELGAGGALPVALAPALQTYATDVAAFQADVKIQLAAAGYPTALTPPTLASTVASTLVKARS
jgi:hypothetical protein